MGGRGVFWIRRAVVAALLALAVAAASVPSSARADGDPASDYLLGNQVFLSSLPVAPSASQRQLLSLVRAANRAGFAIRVATISTQYDLGSITALWQRPRIYARFLGLELSHAYTQRLLVVMPGGFGFVWPGHSTASAYRLLAGVRIGSRETATAAQAAVRQLAGAAGVRVSEGPNHGAGAVGRAHGQSVGLIVALSGLGAVVLIAVVLLLARRRRSPEGLPEQGQARTAAASRPSRRLRWALPASVAVLLALGIPIVIESRHANASGTAQTSLVTPPPFSWPAGARLAPELSLRDQYGRPVSLGRYRGRPVIVTFIDPVCRNLCPLEAKLLNDVVASMPAARRPAIIAVSIDVYADTRADLLQDERKWALVPQWRWAVGSPAALAAVWNRYKIGVAVVTKHIAGTTIHYITHTEGAYVIDSTGHERALFLWPFYPQDVERVLGRVA